MLENLTSLDSATFATTIISTFFAAIGASAAVIFGLLQRQHSKKAALNQLKMLQSQEAFYRLNLAKEFRNSDIDESMMQIRNYLRADYFINSCQHPKSLENILGEYKLYDAVKKSRIQSIVLNKRLLKSNVDLSLIERDLFVLIEKSIRQFELLKSSGVDEYEYNHLASALLNALKSLEQCNQSESHDDWIKQLKRIKSLLH